MSIPNSTLSNDYFDKVAGRTHDDEKQNKKFENLLPDNYKYQRANKTFKQPKIAHKRKSSSKIKTLRDE